MSEKDPQQEEKEKRFLMWSAITFFMVLIVSLWVFNIKENIRNISQEGSGITQNIQEKEELESTMNNISQEWDKLKELQPQTEDKNKEKNNTSEQEYSEQKRILQEMNKNLNSN